MKRKYFYMKNFIFYNLQEIFNLIILKVFFTKMKLNLYLDVFKYQ